MDKPFTLEEIQQMSLEKYKKQSYKRFENNVRLLTRKIRKAAKRGELEVKVERYTMSSNLAYRLTKNWFECRGFRFSHYYKEWSGTEEFIIRWERKE